MIRLKNVSKFYYSKGVIATGFSKVNLEFKIGEFVAITGESGSGKSTLLNVISGLDSYEEGEMYIDGQETSHYLEKDWENYRRRNIGNIYQNFNLVNSYTVYQNIELVLSLNGVKGKEKKEKINSLLKKVDMYKYRNTKVSKLSGGQKQRIAIARALAKDIPIIIADEPTGSLDKKSAMNIIKLLKEISEDKLVIIVTHNYEQVSDYVTRKITMHDGKILEDRKFKTINEEISRKEVKYKNINFLNKFKLGFRNTFNVLPKFILLFLVYSLIVASLMGEYSFFRKYEYEYSKNGYNYIFNDTDDKRVIINKKDKSEFTNEEIEKIKNMENVAQVIENDILVDEEISFSTSSQSLWLYGKVKSKDLLKGKVDVGRLPTNEKEIIIAGDKDSYALLYEQDSLLNKKVYTVDDYGEINQDMEFEVVGIKYTSSVSNSYDYVFYLSNEMLDKFLFETHQRYSTITIDFMGKNRVSNSYSNMFKLVPNNKVPIGSAIISEDLNMLCDKGNCINKTFNIFVKNKYYNVNTSLRIDKTYNQNTINKLVDLNNYKKEDYQDLYNGIIYINTSDYNSLFNKNTYQMSIYVNDINNLNDVVEKLNNANYNTLAVKDTLIKSEGLEMMKIFKFIITCILVLVLFFISYFIIQIILKSRNIYFAVLRMLGASKRVCKELLIIELFVISNVSYFLFIGIAELNKANIISVNFINTVNRYFTFNDYIVLYIIITLMSLLVSIKYASKLFKSSVMSVYREEV